MTLPKTRITKVDGNTGSVSQSATGVLAIIATCASLTPNVAASFARQDLALAATGQGPLIEYAAYVMPITQNPVLLVAPTASTAASYGTVTHTGVLGTSVPSAGATNPLDDYQVVVTCVVGGTIGVAGITYTYSLDGGLSVSAVQALGTATTLTIPNSGVSFVLAAGTLLAADTFSCNVQHARMTTGDLTAALEALRVSRIPWDDVLIDGECTAATITLVDAWLTARESEGKYHCAYLNTRHKNLPVPSAESEATFAAAMATLVASSASIRLSVGTDAADLTSSVTALTLPRPTSLFLAARVMSIPIGRDAAFGEDGPLPGPQISDANGNPKWHDEALYAGLDDQRLTTLRTENGANGVFITNPLLLSPAGSDYVYVQHARVMNAACTVAFQVLTRELSRGVRKKAPNPQTGKIYIDERDARAIEAMVNEALAVPLEGQVTDFLFTLSRTDDLSANSGATVNSNMQIETLAYIKQINVNAGFAKSISRPIAVAA